jgi:hypothetical protein
MNRKMPIQVTYLLLRVSAGVLFSQAGGLILFGVVWRHARPTKPSAFAVADGYRRSVGILWWHRDHARSVHADSRFHFVRHDGSCILAVSRTEWYVAGAEPRHACGPVLFHFPVHSREGSRRLES